MNRTVLLSGSAFLLLSSLFFVTGCGNRHTDAIRRINQMMDQQQYVPALDDLTAEIMKDPKSKELKRLRVILLIRYERVDMAYAAYMELLKISPNDQVLMDALRSKDAKVRAGAARVLGYVGTKLAVQSLERLASDPDRDVRRAVVAALGEIRDPRATEILIKSLKDEWWFVRSDSAQALGKIRDVTAVEPLFVAMNDSDSSVQLAAENALLTISRLPNAPREIYSRYAHDSGGNPEAQRVALLSLSVLKDASAVPPLIKLAGSPEPRKRAQAIRALGILQSPDALSAVRKAASDPEPVVRLQAVEALGEYRDMGSMNLLKTISNSPTETPLIKRASMIALLKLTQIVAPRNAAPAPVPAQ